ncbi:helix-turn-helix transcriptional regulator [Christensenellaceae bacterium OttesenSCG-928-K19]|nr:helix-turn-helix transcriptional regulator [Christensenellaceae bacterium OttesenSCG-928-K19]
MTINERVKAVREELGLSQIKFAEGISISNGYLASIETGIRKVNDRLVKLISSTYGASTKWLQYETGKMFDAKPNVNQSLALNVFNKLEPAYQGCAIAQMKNLLKMQKSGS